MLGYVRLIKCAVVREVDQQSAEQSTVGTGLQPKKQVGIARSIRAPRIDDDNACSALLLVGNHPLKQNRMAPRRIRTYEHQQIGFVQVSVRSGNGIGAEGTSLTGNR